MVSLRWCELVARTFTLQAKSTSYKLAPAEDVTLDTYAPLLTIRFMTFDLNNHLQPYPKNPAHLNK